MVSLISRSSSLSCSRFKRFDQSQDGVLDRWEVKQVLKEMGYMLLCCTAKGPLETCRILQGFHSGKNGKSWKTSSVDEGGILLRGCSMMYFLAMSTGDIRVERSKCRLKEFRKVSHWPRDLQRPHVDWPTSHLDIGHIADIVLHNLNQKMVVFQQTGFLH